MRFDLIDLRLFLLVVEAGSITHGAASANMTLPSASARLRGMEELIGTPLLERGRRGISLTSAGDALAHHARIVLRQMDRLHGELGEYAKGMRGQIRIHANTAAVTEFLPGPLGRYLAAHSRIDIDLKERLSKEIVATISSKRADIGIISDAVDAGSLQLFPFATDRLVLVVPRSHALAGRKLIDLATVAGEDFVGLGDASPLQDHIVEELASRGRKLSFRVRVRTFDGVCRMVAEGAGLGIVPATAASRLSRAMPIGRIKLSDSWTIRRLLICVHDIETLSRPARALVDHLETGAGNSI